MPWWGVLLIVIGAIIVCVPILLFIVYMCNLDSKLLCFMQRKMQKVYDKRKRNRHIE